MLSESSFAATREWDCTALLGAIHALYILELKYYNGICIYLLHVGFFSSHWKRVCATGTCCTSFIWGDYNSVILLAGVDWHTCQEQ